MAPLSARDVSDQLDIPYYAVLAWAAEHGVPKAGPVFIFDDRAIAAIGADFPPESDEDDDDEDDEDDEEDEDDEDEDAAGECLDD